MDGVAGGRAKRQKIDKHGRMSAMEKLKLLKSTGSKRKYEVDDVDNVYETVDENVYTERVLQRQEDDWIDDDDGNGYIEDGREIFDDEEVADSINSSSHTTQTFAKKRKARVAALSDPVSSSKGKSNIRNLITNMPTKKKEVVKLSDDDILSDIISEAQNKPQRQTPLNNIAPKKLVESSNFLNNSKRETQNYFKTLNATKMSKPSKTVTTNSRPSFHTHELKEESYTISQIDSPIKSEDILADDIKLETFSQNIEEFDTPDANTLDVKIPETENKTPNCLSDTIDDITADDFLEFENKPVENSNTVIPQNKNNWLNVAQTAQQSVTYDTTSLPLCTLEDGSKVLRFYWWDAWEDRFVKPGVVFLFGKIYIDHSNPSSGCISCCICVKNVDRKLYLLPREYKLDPISLEENSDDPVSLTDVYIEFNENVAPKLDIKKFKSRKVTKNYAFDLPNIPVQSDYLEVRYEASYPAPPADNTYLTFSHVFGSNTSSLETFLLEKKIKGPCWLEIKNPEYVSNKISWCKLEANCMNPDDISVLRNENPPPLTIATLHCRTIVDPKTRLNTILMLSCLISEAFEIHKPPANPPFQQHFCVFTRSSNDMWPSDIKQFLSQYKGTKATKCESERELLSYFLVQFWKLDPDLVVGHDLLGYQQDLLIGNILDKKIPNWSRLGRLKRTVIPQKKFASKDAFLGRLVCDIKTSSTELIRSRSYDLETLCANILKIPENSRTEILPEELYKYYETSEDLSDLISCTMQDAMYILRIMCELNVLPLALKITQIAGNVMSRTLMGGRSERNEFLLLHAFTEKDYIVPDKVYGKKQSVEQKNEEFDNAPNDKLSKMQIQSRKKPAYLGGLVLDPKKGFYDNLVLLMDFNSLYPSIIQEYNICFTTVKRGAFSSDEEINDKILPDSSIEPGILPIQIKKLVESRRDVKNLMKASDLTPDLYMQYNIRQLALKLTANSMYGCLGFTHSRFYAKSLAALVTLKGREILTNTKEIVTKLNYDVIYGDTDSIMINTNCVDYDQVFKIGYDIKREINRKYKHIELDIDGVFKYLLLLKKKKYAAVSMSKNKNGEFVLTQEFKGLDIVRRDWSQLAAEAGKFILNQLLCDQSFDERIGNVQAYLGKLKEDLFEGKMPLSALTITKQLTKNPNEYPDKNSQPHVQVSLRLNSKNGRRYKKGDIVPYLICEDGTSNAAMQRAYHIEELKNSESLKVDVKYYTAHQLHPVISRICAPIEGLDSSRIADFLGLDPSSYIKKELTDDSEIFQIENEKNKYRECRPFSFTCINDRCTFVNTIKEIDVKFLEKCQNHDCNMRPVDYMPALVNQLNVQIRQYHSKYYQNWLVCEDPGCTNRTVKLPHVFAGGYPLCNLCEKGVMFREYSEKDLYYQMSFFLYLFDVNNMKSQKSQLSGQSEMGFHCLRECIEDALSHSSYSVINLSNLFGFYDTKKNKSSVKVKVEPLTIDTPDGEFLNANEYLDITI